jgi:ABC-2 type transport system permease protein
MKRILLVARQEFRQFASTRGFWITLLLLPLIALGGGALPQLIAKQRGTEPYVIVDQEGGWAQVIDAGFERAQQREELRAFGEYARRWSDPAKLPTTAPWAAQNRNEADLNRFLAQGGIEAALHELQSILKPDAPAFAPPRPAFERVALPEEIDPVAEPTRIGAALAPWLAGERRLQTASGTRRIAAAILIPRGFGPAAPDLAAQIWTVNVTDERLGPVVRAALTEALQRAAWDAAQVARGTVDRVQTVAAQIQSFDPGKTGTEKRVSMADTLARIFLPLTLGFFLFLSVQTVATRMLTSTIEERSSRLLDMLLSAVTPRELLLGKLLGMGTAGLLMVVFWTAALVTVIRIDPSFAFGAGAVALDAISGSPLLLGSVFYYLLAFTLYASLFLAVGCTARSINEAQGLLFPVVMLTMIPFLAMQPVLQDPNGPIAVALTWIPLYTPYLMILRSAASPPLWQVIGATALCLAFTVLLIGSLGRIFRWSLLAGDTRASFRQLIRIALRPAASE